jgi:superfamily I DNA and/or RNA helicase
MFYNHKLIADKSVCDRRVMDGEIITYNHVVGEEKMQKDSKSYYNDLEIEGVQKWLEQLKRDHISKDQIAIITPYKGQVRRMRSILDDYEIDTVDAFQGREKDVVIISFVRSNLENQLGFLKDYRRLNVSISRAKSRLILIGNMDLLRSNDLYDALLETIDILS